MPRETFSTSVGEQATLVECNTEFFRALRGLEPLPATPEEARRKAQQIIGAARAEADKIISDARKVAEESNVGSDDPDEELDDPEGEPDDEELDEEI